MNPFDYQEREIYRQLFTRMLAEHRNYGKTMSSEIFSQRIFNNVELAIKYLRDLDKQRVIQVLKGMKMEKRGKEECDCSKGLGKCGCSVRDFNDAVEENNFSVDLAITSLTKLLEK